MKTKRTLVWLLTVLAVSAPPVQAYEVESHAEISTRAAEVSAVWRALAEELGVTAGADATFLGLTASRLVEDGARFEDDALRYRNHFHNPLLPWKDAGLDALGVRAQSSVLWQQDPAQDSALLGGGDWSWQDARRRLLTALTGEAPAAREEAFAELFRNLGHLVHLIQDASVPAHTRNDAHAVLDGYERWVEWVRSGAAGRKPALRSIFTSLLALPPVGSPASIFTPTGDERAPVPVARLIDSDRYRGEGLVLSDPALGIAEYTQGNFPSDDTLFLDFPLPRPAALGPAFSVPEGRGRRVYYPKVTDGETVAHFVAEGAWWQRLRFRSSALSDWLLDDRIYQDYAAALLPRAVGYSAALLDYFFRGRLDVEADADPGDPSTLTLRGANLSPEALAEGSLALYAEGVDGRRLPATPLGPVALTGIAAGAPLPPARFQVAGEPERLVAVYRGALGHETAPADGSFPGAVIGRVLGGTRVEEVFLDGDRWKLRTPRGVFPLPLTGSEFEAVTWGDAPDLLVGRTPFGPDRPNRVVAWELARHPGTVEPATDAGGLVQLRQKSEAPLPFGMSLGTTLGVRQTRRYGQRLLRVETTQRLAWNETARAYTQRGFEFTIVEPLVLVPEQTVTYAFDVPITLERANGVLFGSPPYPGYYWDIFDVGADRSGRLLALVVVSLTEPPVAPRTFPLYNIAPTGEPYVHGTAAVPPVFPSSPNTFLWALIDLGAGAVVASTAEPVVTLTLAEAVSPEPVPSVHLPDGRSGFLLRGTTVYEGGDRDGEVVGPGAWGLAAFLAAPATLVTELRADSGFRDVTLDGFLVPALRAALAGAGARVDFAVAGTPVGRNFVYGCEIHSPPTNCSALRLTGTSWEITAAPLELSDAVRVRAAEGAERLALLADRRVFAWEPAAARAELRAAPGGEFAYLGAAAGRNALVTFGVFRPERVSRAFVPLEAPGEPVSFDDPELAFTVLAPDHLYDAATGRFHRPGTPPVRLPLPARLVDAAGAHPGDFHALRLP